MSRWARLVVLTLLLAVSGCAGADNVPTPREQNRQADTAPRVGESVKFFLYTHCGVESARIGGRWWLAVNPLYGEGGEGVNPPAGWDNPHQEGTLLMQSPNRAVFQAKGTDVVFVPAPDDQPARICR